MRKMLVQELKPYEKPINVQQDTPVIELVKNFVDHPRLHNLCVINEKGILMGLINRKRLFKAVFSHFIAADSRISHLYTLTTSEYAGDLLIKHVISIKEQDCLDDLIKKMINNDLYEIPVMDEAGKVLGFLTAAKILSEWLLQQSANKKDDTGNS